MRSRSYLARPRQRDLAFAPLDFTGAFKRGQRAIKCLMGQSEFRSEVLERTAQIDGPAVGVGVDREKMTHAFARRTDIALLDTRAQTHDLPRQRRGEGLRGLWILIECGKHRWFRIDADQRVGAGDGVAVIG